MKYKISAIERKVGLLVVISVAALFLALVAVVMKSHFFKKTVNYTIQVESVNQLQKGTKVQVRGLNIGSVTDINVADASEFKVHLEIDQKYHGFMKKGSSIHLKNPLIVGEKILEVVIGEGPELLEDGANLEVNEGEDIIKRLGDINWQKVNAILEKFDSVMNNTDIVMKALSRDLPKTTARAPKIAEDAEAAVKELNSLLKEFSAMKPEMKKAISDLPSLTNKGEKAISEAIIVLRAAQKSWLLKSNVKEVKKEMESESK